MRLPGVVLACCLALAALGGYEAGRLARDEGDRRHPAATLGSWRTVTVAVRPRRATATVTVTEAYRTRLPVCAVRRRAHDRPRACVTAR